MILVFDDGSPRHRAIAILNSCLLKLFMHILGIAWEGRLGFLKAWMFYYGCQTNHRLGMSENEMSLKTLDRDCRANQRIIQHRIDDDSNSTTRSAK